MLPPPRADHVDIHHRRLDRIARDVTMRGEQRTSVAHQRYVRAGAAHVEGHEVRAAEGAPHRRGAHHAGGRAGQAGAHGILAHRGDRHQAAVGMDGVRLVANIQVAHALQEPLQVARHLRSDRRVQHRGGQALVLAELGQHVGRHADVGIRHDLGHDLRRAALVRRIAVGMQEADGHRLDAGLRVPDRRLPHLVFGKRRQHLARRIHAFIDFGAELARHGHRRLAHAVVVQVRARLAADFQHVAKPPRGDQPDPRALALDDEIGGHRRAMAHVRHLGGRDAALREHLADAGGDGLRRIVRRGGHLVEVHRAGVLVDHREVGKRAADVYPYAIHVLVPDKVLPGRQARPRGKKCAKEGKEGISPAGCRPA